METRKYILTVECKNAKYADCNFNDLEEMLTDLRDEHKVIESYKLEIVEEEQEYDSCTMTYEEQEHYGQCVDPQCPYYKRMSEEKRVNAMRLGMFSNSNIQ